MFSQIYEIVCNFGVRALYVCMPRWIRVDCREGVSPDSHRNRSRVSGNPLRDAIYKLDSRSVLYKPRLALGVTTPGHRNQGTVVSPPPVSPRIRRGGLVSWDNELWTPCVSDVVAFIT